MATSMVSKPATTLFEFGQSQSSQQALSVAHLVNPTPTSATPLLPPFQFTGFQFPSPTTSDQDKIKQLQQIILQETQLIKELSKTYEPQIKEILRKKEEAISLILCDSPSSPATVASTSTKANTTSVTVEQPTTPRSPVSGSIALQIVQQPPEVAVSNRYLTPAPTVQVISSTPRTNLHVSASLVHGTTEVELIKTVDGRHDVLQGIKKIVVDATGKIAFNKLKIVEVSSKHKHQAFCLIFSLEEMVQGRKRVLAQVKTAPFHVQSRPNKRKLSSAPSSPLPDSGAPSMKRIKSADAISSNELSASDDSDEDYDPAKAPTNDNSSHDYNYIDITDLLKLPQKEAAKRLGISESMLCKRFKECTRRKWPYRYLRKIEKVINILNLHKTDGSIPKEDRDKLEKLLKEREECLRPVKIRITAYDKLTAANERPEREASPSATNTASLSAEEDDEDEIPDDILETLGKLKSSPPRGL